MYPNGVPKIPKIFVKLFPPINDSSEWRFAALGDRVVATRIEGVTSEDSPDAEIASFKEAVLRKRLDKIG
jgi:hypothetical protein